ncbi:hypothetical protein FKM82_003553 [Ascaphus truei]
MWRCPCVVCILALAASNRLPCQRGGTRRRHETCLLNRWIFTLSFCFSLEIMPPFPTKKGPEKTCRGTYSSVPWGTFGRL